MHELTRKEMNQIRLLALLPLLAGLFWSFSTPEEIYPDKAVPSGEAIITINSSDNNEGNAILVEQSGTEAPNRIFINSATFEQLLLCPGIGKKTAEKILLERTYGKFVDWRDLQDRVKGITKGKVEKLIEAGVRLDHKNLF
jgi:DNA uptake protein ComE-like DNA-binding protein